MIVNPATGNEICTGVTSSFRLVESATPQRLTNGKESEVLEFLAARSLHNAVMSGLIRDNGLESALNRGTFYACRDPHGQLGGVALIGHAIFIDARCDDALSAFAELAQGFDPPHMIMGEQKVVARFWALYSRGGQSWRRLCREVLFALNEPPRAFRAVPELRRARLDELALVVPIHAALAMDESGVSPLVRDAGGFWQRCRRRVERGRVWVVIEDDEMLFKADVISETPEVIYLEGGYVHPHYRGQGFGSRCLAQLSRDLLRRTKAISLLVNEEHYAAQRLFQKVGFISRGRYETIFLHDRRWH